ncbi:BA14K family protein, partial [Methylobacterium sp. CCH5-D2]
LYGGYGYPGYGYDDGYYGGYAPAGYGYAPVNYGYAETDGSAEEACARRFRTYDPRTGTYIAKGGVRRACP